MMTFCQKCTRTYDDFDHLTYCPHDYFPPGGFGSDAHRPGPIATYAIKPETVRPHQLRFSVRGEHLGAVILAANEMLGRFFGSGGLPATGRWTIDADPGEITRTASGDLARLGFTADIECRW